MKTALVCGGTGFIGHHLSRRLKKEGYHVTVADIRPPLFESVADKAAQVDLRNMYECKSLFRQDYDEVYQLAADMGGAEYIFSGEHDFSVMQNSATINLNIASFNGQYEKIFFSSSACVYPEVNQEDPDHPHCEESSVYPANPDSEYGWEKLFSERLYQALARNNDVKIKIARFHNIYGPECVWNNGKEKAPAAICRKVANSTPGGIIDIFGDGKQTRSFLYIEDCLDAVRLLVNSDFSGPYNIGSEEMISINNLAKLVASIADKTISINHIDGPLGVRGRTSDNTLIGRDLQWSPKIDLRHGMEQTYAWIQNQIFSM